MRTKMKDLRPAPSALAFALLLFPMRLDDPAKPKVDLKVPLPMVEHAADDPHAEMARIFGQIEQDLREIDRLLSDASAGGASAKGAEEKAAKAIAGIDELLAKSEKRSQAVLQGIDKLFELADHPHEPGGT
ncbi:MAG: hypothetical protein ACKVXR_06010 [Planctomycetota bacterium]